MYLEQISVIDVAVKDLVDCQTWYSNQALSCTGFLGLYSVLPVQSKGTQLHLQMHTWLLINTWTYINMYMYGITQ